MIAMIFFAFLPGLAFWASVGVALYLQIAESCNEPAGRRKKLFHEAVVTTVTQSAAMLALYGFFDTKWQFRWWTIPIGMFATDMFQYCTHYLYHKRETLFLIHATHHELRPMSALGALHNSWISKSIGGFGLIILFKVVLRYSFLEFSILTSLAMIAVVREHCPGRGDTPHRRHHEGRQGNWQEPFGSYIDYFFGTNV